LVSAAVGGSRNARVDGWCRFIVSVCVGAILLSDLGVVVSFLGALLGSFVIYVFPSLMYRRARKAEVERASEPAALGMDYHVAGGLIGTGVFLGASPSVPKPAAPAFQPRAAPCNR